MLFDVGLAVGDGVIVVCTVAKGVLEGVTVEEVFGDAKFVGLGVAVWTIRVRTVRGVGTGRGVGVLNPVKNREKTIANVGMFNICPATLHCQF